MLYNEEIELDEDFEGVDDSEAEVVTEFDEIDENTDYDNNYTYVDIDFPQDTPQLINTPTPVVDPVVEETELIPDTEYETVTETYEIIIQEYSQEYLQSLEDDGYTFYVIYEDGTEDEVDISEIEEPTTSIEFLDDEAYVLANSILEHFWDDDSGVHVTQDSKEDWEQLVDANFPDLDATHPHHNIIVNSYGVLIRSALKNLVQLSRSALAFYDGLGNNSSNIISTFGRGGIQIGPTDQKHLIINNNGITVYNGDGTIAPLTASNIQAIEANIQTLTAADVSITNRLTAAEGDIDTLETNTADIGTIRANSAKVSNLTAVQLEAANAYISALTAGNVTASDIIADTGKVHSLTANELSAATAYIAALIAGSVTASDILADHAVVDDLDTNYAHISNGVIDNATIGHANVNGLSANYATIANLNTANGRITTLEATDVTINGRLDAAEADIDTLDTNKANVTDLTAATARIGTLETNTADIVTIRANSAKVANLTAAQLEADHATVGALDTNYAQVNMANVNNAWIQNGTVKDGAITNAMIYSVSANKLTAGTIDASDITVTNLNADNITAGTLNGQRIGSGTLSLDKLEEDVYTETEVDNIVDGLNDRIDGAIETFTGTVIPTLNNTPASAWTTNDIKDTHIGDVYYVVNSQSDQNGYCYRFTKINNAYSWQLIKDSDVTAALARLSNAEDAIGTIEQFDSEISSWKIDTDTELSSIKANHTSLATRVETAEGTLSNKVDTSTFNTLSQTVDGHSSSITQLTTETTTLTQAVDTLNTKTSNDSGNIIQFSDSIGFKEIVVHGKSIQNGTPTPDSPVEIESIDDLTLHVCGKNLFRAPTWAEISSLEQTISYYHWPIYLKPNTTYYVSNTEHDGYTSIGTGYYLLFSPNMQNGSWKSIAHSTVGATSGTITTDDSGIIYLAVYGYGNQAKYEAAINGVYTMLTEGSTAVNYEPYQGHSIDIPLGDHQIRSLPDGTDDTLTFSYIGPSIREGWGLYNTKLMQNVGTYVFPEEFAFGTTPTDLGDGWYRYVRYNTISNFKSGTTGGYCDRTVFYPSASAKYEHVYISGAAVLFVTQLATSADANAALIGGIMQYPGAPQTYDLGVVELPLSEDLNLWASTSPFTTIDATWWHVAGRDEKNAIDISLTTSNLGDAIDSTTLPAPYTQVEWVESDGHQFIATRYQATQDSGFDIDVALLDGIGTNLSKSRGKIDQGFVNVDGTTYTGTMFGTYYKGSLRIFGLSSNGASGRAGWVGCNATNAINANGSIGFYTDGRRQQASLRNRVYTAPDGTVKTLTSSSNFITDYYVYVFAAHETATATTSPVAMRLYSLKFYDGNELAMDLIPAIRNSDDVPGLYDSIEKHFYPCQTLNYGSKTGTSLGEPLTLLETIAQESPIVLDTRTKNSRIMTGDCPVLTDLRDGQRLIFTSRYTYATETAPDYPGTTGSSSNCLLDLTLANGKHVPWGYVYYNVATIMTSHYGAGSTLNLVYRENVLVGTTAVRCGFFCDSDYNTNTNDTARYIQWYNNVFAKKAIRNASIIVGDETGYEEIDEEVTFDLAYPILWRTAALAINKTDYQYSWTLTYDRTLATCYPNVSGVKNQILYLVGEPNGGKFTIKSPMLTFDIPTEEDGLYYIPIGKLGNQSTGQNYLIFSTVPNPTMFAFVGDAFQQVQGLVIKTTTKLNETIDTVDEHTQKIGVLETTVESKADGSDVETISNTLNTVSQTATSNSQKITNLTTRLGTNADGTAGVNDIIAKESALEQDLDGFKTTVSSTYTTKTEFNELEIGGRNLVRGTSFASDSDLTYWYKNQNPILSVESGSLKIVSNQTSSTPGVYADISIEEGKYTVSFWYKAITENGMRLHTVSLATSSRNSVIPHVCSIVISDIEWHYYEHVFEVTATQAESISTLAIFLYPVGYAATDGIYIRHLKLEKGNRATDWTPAPEDISSRVSAAESSITQNATNINLKVSKDGVISSINQSAESVKIDASKVEINGTAIFTNEDFREAADAAYASKASEDLIETASSNAETALQTALDGAFLVLTSTNGQLFKNGSESTILQVAVFPNGGDRCDTITQVRNRFGASAYIEWKWMHESSGEWGTLLSNDTHLSQGGMWLTVGPDDVATKTTFAASLVVPD